MAAITAGTTACTYVSCDGIVEVYIINKIA